MVRFWKPPLILSKRWLINLKIQSGIHFSNLVYTISHISHRILVWVRLCIQCSEVLYKAEAEGTVLFLHVKYGAVES